tara:strand:+ start:2000 stop:2482 length:483 start_codon:yes stop_codon:yes gene_type:complete
MKKIMTPLEIADYKSNWSPGHFVQVDMDSDRWGKDFCKIHFEQQIWSFSKHTEPDDSHTFYFEEKVAAEKFLTEYNRRNPRFHRVGEAEQTDDELRDKIAFFEHKIVEINDLIEAHKADGKIESAMTCEKIKQIYANELHYIKTGEEIILPWEDEIFADD